MFPIQKMWDMNTQSKVMAVSLIAIAVIFSATMYVAVIYNDEPGEDAETIMPRNSYGDFYLSGTATFEDGSTEDVGCIAHLSPVCRIGDDMLVEINFEFGGIILFNNLEYLGDPFTLIPRTATLTSTEHSDIVEYYDYTDPRSGADITFTRYHYTPVQGLSYEDQTMYPISDNEWKPVKVSLTQPDSSTAYDYYRIHYIEGPSIGTKNTLNMTGTETISDLDGKEISVNDVKGRMILQTVADNDTEGANTEYSEYRTMKVMQETGRVAEKEYFSTGFECTDKGYPHADTVGQTVNGIDCVCYSDNILDLCIDTQNNYTFLRGDYSIYYDADNGEIQMIKIVGTKNIIQFGSDGDIRNGETIDFELTATL